MSNTIVKSIHVAFLMMCCFHIFSTQAQTAEQAPIAEKENKQYNSQHIETNNEQTPPAVAQPDFKEPLFKPFIERYILDDLKNLRQEQQHLRAEVIDRVADAKLEASDRAIRYTADTTNVIFYIITAAASILVIMGWRSLKDMRETIETITSEKLSTLTEVYEARLSEIENKMKSRSEQILANQENISITNQIHSLWMRAALEKSDKEKIHIYDQILELRPDEVEAIAYKADVLLDMGEKKWALSLANQAIDKDSQYSFAFWQRACANAELGNINDAIDDIQIAIQLSEILREEILIEKSFEHLKGSERFEQLLVDKE
ncbi:tetratricopeptide repeat protein [Flocculibacter collagenilyticus]|uniref:tetratricopeptide repeat protein n=1 Tax=Flocculibacter collagenilyticus TaxID=2744479 RepID=UPI001F38EFDE|nr:tetratricopeptide repeat protein [Flocculibacter collagenilyticus]